MPFPLYIFSLRNVTTDIEMNDSIGVVRKRLRNVNDMVCEINTTYDVFFENGRNSNKLEKMFYLSNRRTEKC